MNSLTIINGGIEKSQATIELKRTGTLPETGNLKPNFRLEPVLPRDINTRPNKKYGADTRVWR